VPKVIPVTIPEVPTVALALVVLHAPPDGSALSVVVRPVQAVAGPVMAPGDWLTVMVVVAVQPVTGRVKVMVGVPEDKPAIVEELPGDVADAMPGRLLVQAPEVVSVRLMVAPVHTCVGPEMAAGAGFTVTGAVAVAVQPKPLVTV